ncbi:tumor necrosis factor receptor superfamily member 21-like [Silurus meridionalis]|nr:tumor necrosis factor receptor superfamily member 21-like [Silurus meridionalis]
MQHRVVRGGFSFFLECTRRREIRKTVRRALQQKDDFQNTCQKNAEERCIAVLCKRTILKLMASKLKQYVLVNSQQLVKVPPACSAPSPSTSRPEAAWKSRSPSEHGSSHIKNRGPLFLVKVGECHVVVYLIHSALSVLRKLEETLRATACKHRPFIGKRPDLDTGFCFLAHQMRSTLTCNIILLKTRTCANSLSETPSERTFKKEPKVSKTCRKDCLPCTNGFTSAPNLNISCQKFKECAMGEQVIANGSSTADRVCGIPFNENLTTTPQDRTDTTRTQRLVSSNPKFHTSHLVSGQASGQNMVTSSPFRTEASPGGPALPFEANSKTTWIYFLLLLIALCLVLCLSLKCKSSAIKCRLEQAGLVFRRYPVFPGVSSDPDAPVPVSDVTDLRDQSQGQGSFPGKNQKVTMEHVGKSDGINNTVGSIFIYSPGMVILGSNSNEKKEEVFSGGEEEEEDVRLMSVPQQESSSEEVLIRLATQEELDKELSIPVPATSK